MAIVTAQKIFTDVDDEINFVIEKVLGTEKDEVILVVPQNALVVSSQVSIKILFKQIMKSKKVVIMVTEDEFGANLAAAAGLLATSKVSNITPDMWDQALAKKEQYVAERDAKKQQLLARRGIVEPALEHEAEVAAEPVTEPVTKPEVEPVIAEEVPPEEEIKGAIQRPRQDAKMVKVGGLQVFAGGDITMIESVHASAQRGVKGAETMIGQEGGDLVGDGQDATPKPRGGFTGRDWTKYTSDSNGSKFNLAKFWPFRREPEPVAPGERKIKKIDDEIGGANRWTRRRKLIIAGIIVFLLFLVIGGYVLAFRLSSVEVKITLKTTEVPVEQLITVDTAVTEIDELQLVLPALEISEEELSISGSGDASGESVRGTKAAGLIEIWNKTQEEIELLEGTELTEISSNRKYVLKENVTLPPAELDPNDPNLFASFGGAGDELRIEAKAVGSEYNLTDPDSGLEFSVKGYNTNQLIGKRFRDIDGGSSETFRSVSEEDFKDLKKGLSKSLEDQSRTRIADAVPEGYRLILGTELFEETESHATPDIGEEATSFNVSITGKVTALAVSEADLQSAIEILVSRDQDIEGEFEVTGLENAAIAEVTRDGSKATFTITSQGSLRGKLTELEIKEAIVGMSIPDAQEYFAGIEDIESFSVSFNPGLVPEALRRIPTDLDRIRVTF
jgi:hypothetical protein